MTLSPYDAARGTKRVLAHQERGSFPTYQVIERNGHLLALLNIGVG